MNGIPLVDGLPCGTDRASVTRKSLKVPYPPDPTKLAWNADMSTPENPSKLVQRLSLLFVLWLCLWLILLGLLPRDCYTTGFFLLGILPVVGWFMIQPRRITWFLAILFGVNRLGE